MNSSNRKTPARSTRTAWYLSERVTIGGYDYLGTTSERAFDAGMAGVLGRIWQMTGDTGEASMIVDRAAAYRLGLLDDSPANALTNAQASGWKTSAKVGMWTTFYAADRPSLYIGQLDAIEADAADDPSRWPFASTQLRDTIAQMQRWHDLTGIAWQATPAVMGIELMHRTLPGYRLPDTKGVHRPAKNDKHTPVEAGEAVWTPKMWRRPMADVAAELDHPDVVWLHTYDKVRAGLTAAGVAKLCPPQLDHAGPWRGFDPKRAGWWLISIPPWNEPRLPHPCGPGSEVWARKWVTTATMDLLAELAAVGEIDMPEPIESRTGPARTILLPWAKVLEEAYDAPLVPEQYYEQDRDALRAAIKETATRGVGMLAHDGSTIYRPDQFNGINATKRCNGWRMAYRIGKGENRWPVAIDDDAIIYASADADAYASAPASFSELIGSGPRRRQLDGDQPGDYRVQVSTSATKRAAA